LGSGKASWTVPNDDKTDQVLLTLSVSAEEPTKLSGGFIRMGGCFPHNCPEKAEVFFEPTGSIKAVALLYHDCGSKTCTGREDYTLRVFLRQRSPILIALAKEWAVQELDRTAKAFPEFPPDNVGRTVVQVLN